MELATRIAWPMCSPRVSSSAIVRDASCSTGRNRIETTMKTTDHMTTTRP